MPKIKVCFIFETVIQSDPPLPPSETRRLQKQFEADSNKEFLTLMKRLLTNRSYIALWHSFGVTIGVFNALGTLLNQMYLIHFPVIQSSHQSLRIRKEN